MSWIGGMLWLGKKVMDFNSLKVESIWVMKYFWRGGGSKEMKFIKLKKLNYCEIGVLYGN